MPEPSLIYSFLKKNKKKSVVVKTKKSGKQPLDSARVEKLFSKYTTTIIMSSCFNHCHIHHIVCIEKKYKGIYEHARIMATLGQKCRDASRREE